MSGGKEKRAPAVIQNRKAHFDYEIVDSSEAGIVLVGSEVKSLYLGRGNLTDAYCRVSDGELWVHQFDVEPYDKSAPNAHDRRRTRKLLMHRNEIDQLQRKQDEKGLSIVPTKVYFQKGRVKVTVSTARGKRQYDKRESIKRKETRRELDRELKGR